MAGLTTGGAYLVGGMARTAVAHAQIERLARSASGGFSEQALEIAIKDDSALSIAREHDPYAPAGTAEADHEDRVAAFTDALDARRSSRGFRLANADLHNLPTITPARPFRLRGALDESRDLECLTQAVYYEARGEVPSGQAAVAQVVLNRTRHPAFPKTVCGVVFQGVADGGCQFSFACDGSVGRRVEAGAWRKAQKVAERAMHGFVMAQVGNATHFHVAQLSPSWGPHLLKVAQIGAHVFYKFAGRGGAPAAFTAQAAPSDVGPPPVSGQPVYASLSLAPLANAASSVANSVAGAAEMVMSATKGPAHAATPEAAAKPAPAPEAAKPAPPTDTAKPVTPATAPVAAATAPATTAAVAQPGTTAKADVPAKPAA